MAAKSTKAIKKTATKRKRTVPKLEEKTKVTAIDIEIPDNQKVLAQLITSVDDQHKKNPNSYTGVALLHLKKALRMLESVPIKLLLTDT